MVPALPVWIVGVVLMAVLTAVNLMSARSYGEFEFWFSSIKVAAIIVFILVAGRIRVRRHLGAAGRHSRTSLQHGGFAPYGWAVVLAGVTSTIFSLCGAEIATIAAAESEEPAKDDLAHDGHGVGADPDLLRDLDPADRRGRAVDATSIPGISPFATALRVMGYGGADVIMNAVVLVAVLSCLNSGLYVTSRALFGLAKYGDAPQWLVQVNARKVPARAIVVASLFSYVALAAERLSPERVFSFLLNSSGVTMMLLYLLLSVAQLRLRNEFEASAPERLQIRMWMHPYGTWFAILGLVAIMVFMGLTPALASQLWMSLLVAVGFAAAFALRRMATAG